MGRRPFLPAALLRGPFTLDDALAAGLERWHLEGASWRRIGPSTYVWTGLQIDHMQRLAVALRRLPAGARFFGHSAAWLHGFETDPCDPIEVSVPTASGVVHRSGMAVHRCDLQESETTWVRGLPVTSVLRTVVDLCLQQSLVEAVVTLDVALHGGRVRPEQLTAWADSHAGRRGIRHLRHAIDLSDPASESPMETRLRLVLLLRGLPRPRAQVSIYDDRGRFVGRPDLYYEQQRLGIEYDGGVHRDTMAQDNRRQNNLLRAGVRLLRFTAGDVLSRPESVAGQVRELLASPRGIPANAATRGSGLQEFAASGSRRGKSDLL